MNTRIPAVALCVAATFGASPALAQMAPMDHGQMDHDQMKHGQMKHGQMKHDAPAAAQARPHADDMAGMDMGPDEIMADVVITAACRDRVRRACPVRKG